MGHHTKLGKGFGLVMENKLPRAVVPKGAGGIYLKKGTDFEMYDMGYDKGLEVGRKEGWRKCADQITDRIAEFGDQENCLAIIDEDLNGQKEVVF